MIVKEAHIAPKSFRPVVRDIDFGNMNEDVLLSLSEKLEAISLAEDSVAKEAVPLLKRIDKSTSVLPKIFDRLGKGPATAVKRTDSKVRTAKKARRSSQQSKQSAPPYSTFTPPLESAGGTAPGLPAKLRDRRQTARKIQTSKKFAENNAIPSPPRKQQPPEPERMDGSPPPGPPMQSAAAFDHSPPGTKSVKPKKNKAGSPSKPKSVKAQQERTFFKEQETAIRKGFALSLKQLGGKAYLGARNTLGIGSNDFMAKNRRRKIADFAGNATLGPLYGIVEEVRDFTDEVRDYRRGTYRNESIKGRVLGKLFNPAKNIDNAISRKLGIHSAKNVEPSGTGRAPARDRFGRFVKEDAYSSRRNAVPQSRLARRDDDPQAWRPSSSTSERSNKQTKRNTRKSCAVCEEFVRPYRRLTRARGTGRICKDIEERRKANPGENGGGPMSGRPRAGNSAGQEASRVPSGGRCWG